MAASLANDCRYCVAAHTFGLKSAGLAGEEIEALRNGRPPADRRLEALRTFAKAVVTRRGRVSQDELQQFLAAGYAREQVFEVLVGVAMKTLSNYTNHIAGTSLDEPLQSFAWEPAMA